MSKISNEVQNAVANAITNHKPWCKGSTCIIVDDIDMKVYLHGNYIFRCNLKSKRAEWSDAGQPTKTTCARLNDCFKGIGSKTFIQRKKVNGEWTTRENVIEIGD